MWRKLNLWRGLAALFNVFMILAIFTTLILNEYATTINDFLGISTSRIVQIDGEEIIDSEYYKSTFGPLTPENLDILENAAYAQTVQEAEEGVVLLKNKMVGGKPALPLDEDERKVTLFGYASTNILWKTAAAGTDAHKYNPEYRVDLDEALIAADFSVNQTLFEAYKWGNGATISRRESGSAVWNEEPLSFYTPELRESWVDYNDLAIVVLAREGGEGKDMAVNERDVDGTYISSLALTSRERDMLQMIKEANFGKTIVLINTNYQMELSWLDDFDTYGVDACLFIGTPGLTGLTGVVNILTGAVNPSGRLVSTFAANSLSSPAIVNACGNTPQWVNKDTITISGIVKDPAIDRNYVSVQIENIYVGYKYYETRYADVIMDQGNASSGVGASFGTSSWDYANEICYPFGFGLSYTEFDQTIDGVVKNEEDNTYTITVTVENTGSIAGKTPVQIYVSTPYGQYEKDRNIEKSAILFVGFDKTGVIEPGDSETVEIEIEEYLFASYDSTDAKGYVLTEGDYYFAVGNDAHDALNNVLAEKGFTTGLVDQDGNPVAPESNKTYTWYMDLDTSTYKYGENGVRVTNQFDQMDINYWEGNSVTYLTRSAWDTTFPTAPAQVSLLGEEMETLLQGDFYQKPENARSTDFYAQGKNNNWAGIDNQIPFVNMKDVEYDDEEMWESFIDQFSINDLANMVGSYFGNIEIGAPVNINAVRSGDGCQGVGTVAFPIKYTGESNPRRWACLYTSLLPCTFNKELIESRGTLMANEALYLEAAVISTGGANLHRTPFGGRQAEYYSEDSNLSYIVGYIEITAMEKVGIIGEIKHFTGNDQETRREGVSTFYTEQSFRENALRGFEGAIRKGKCKAVMSAFSRQGVIYSSSCMALNINVLRGEWGFVGRVITDASSGATTGYKSHYTTSITTGTDLYCLDGQAVGGSIIAASIKENDDGYLLEWLRTAAKNNAYALSRSAAINGLTSNTKIITITPAWQITAYAVTGFTILLAAGALVMFGISKKITSREKVSKE